jgi:hypothetical protein
MKYIMLALFFMMAQIGLCDAKTYTIQRIGAWEAYEGTDDAGVPLCGVSNFGSDRGFMIKYWKGSAYLGIQIFKNNWSIPAGLKVSIALRFDSYPQWDTTEANVTPPNILQTRIVGGIPQFLDEFAKSNNLYIYFPSGTEPPWQGGLTGTSVLTQTFARCILELQGQPVPTQPYSQAPTQPFRGNAAPAPQTSRSRQFDF